MWIPRTHKQTLGASRDLNQVEERSASVEDNLPMHLYYLNIVLEMPTNMHMHLHLPSVFDFEVYLSCDFERKLQGISCMHVCRHSPSGKFHAAMPHCLSPLMG